MDTVLVGERRAVLQDEVHVAVDLDALVIIHASVDEVPAAFQCDQLIMQTDAIFSCLRLAAEVDIADVLPDAPHGVECKRRQTVHMCFVPIKRSGRIGRGVPTEERITGTAEAAAGQVAAERRHEVGAHRAGAAVRVKGHRCTNDSKLGMIITHCPDRIEVPALEF